MKLNFFLFFFFFLQKVSGNDDAVDTGEGVTEMDESVAEQQKMALEITGDVATRGGSVDKDDIMANEIQMAVVAGEATLVMVDEAAWIW